MLMSFGIKRSSCPGQYLGKFDSVLLNNYIDMLKLEEVLDLPITKLANVNFPVQLKFESFTFPYIVLIPFYTDDEVSWMTTELHSRWAASSDLRDLVLKRCPFIDVETA